MILSFVRLRQVSTHIYHIALHLSTDLLSQIRVFESVNK